MEDHPIMPRGGSVTKARRNTMILIKETEKKVERRLKHAYSIISLVIGFLLWFGIDLKRMEDLTIEVGVELRQRIPANWELVEQPQKTVRVTVRGSRQDMAGVNKDAIELEPELPGGAQLDEANLFDGVIPVRPSQIHGLPPGVEALSVAPELLPIRLSKIVTRPMTVAAGDVVGSPQEGYALGKIQRIDPPNLSVTLPSRLAAQIGASDVLRTKPIDINGARGLVGRLVGLEPFEKDGERVEIPGYVYVIVELDEVSMEREMPAPLEVRALIESPFDRYGNLNLSPPSAKVTVSGPKSMIDKLAQGDITVYADIRERVPAASGEFNIRCRAIAPPNVRVVRIDPDTVKWLERAP